MRLQRHQAPSVRLPRLFLEHRPVDSIRHFNLHRKDLSGVDRGRVRFFQYRPSRPPLPLEALTRVVVPLQQTHQPATHLHPF